MRQSTESRGVAMQHSTPEIKLGSRPVDEENKLQCQRKQSAVGRTYVESQAAIRQWITRLESEVRRFKTENTNLLRLKAEREESMKRLECETKKFEEMREKERKLFSDYRENEMRKLNFEWFQLRLPGLGVLLASIPLGRLNKNRFDGAT
ncbi:hypothetical protein CSKR_201946 [Clonorchis sinensis]|uniref:Uncharacterized protein n=1 Tax=Clonorchis sinensis TaxID=79923 RepID=A0A8T1MYY9_CLOSI|nr:hypothetical protein CSKR_201946 [Clonorchis sinensis]